MTEKKSVEIKEKKTTTISKSKEKYIGASGGRKTATVQVRLYPQGSGEVVINDKKLKEYFPQPEFQRIVLQSLKMTDEKSSLDLSIKVKGGGVHGQAEAIRHGISRALVKYNEEYRTTLKKNGFLTRDARKKERKKPGLKKARRAPQWKKR
ncbi:MAG: 30S ribosomal protein S9 [Patescibacteria group bacterium]|nr:30S ribosomal protein S9 [Patescibacteria group bacterium]